MSATFFTHPNEIASIWLCRPHEESNSSGHLSLVSPTKVIFKFRNPANGSIYARFLQVHPRNHFKNESALWPGQNTPSLSNLPSPAPQEDDFLSVDLPTIPPDRSASFFLSFLKNFTVHIDTESFLLSHWNSLSE